MAYSLLVVEDEAHLAFMLEFNLVQEGYSVHTANDLVTAQEYISSGTYDLILLDVMLPDGNGIEFCERLRQSNNRVPILFLTAKGTADDIVTGLHAGGDDYLSKPFALKELLGRVNALLRRRSWDGNARDPEQDDILNFGDNAVNFTNHTAVAKGEPVELTDLEIRLVRFFSTNRDRVVSRKELLEEVWGVSGNSNTRTVDNFIVRLRRLFEADPSKPAHFLTVRGVGYRFVTNA